MKSLLLPLLAAATFAGFSLPAATAAADGRITATLATPQTAKTQLIAFHSVWNCAGETCIAGETPDDAQTVSGCKELAKQVGPVTAYAGDAKTLDAAALAKCNTAAASPAPIGTASR